MAHYPVKTNADAITIEDVSIDGVEGVILLDDKPLNLENVIKKIKQVITDTKSELDNTKDIDI